MAGLYIHVPICVAKCRYCDFYSVVSRDTEMVDRFFRSLEKELQRLEKPFAPESIFIGGGTPTAIRVEQLARLFEIIHSHIDLSRVREWSCEANPGTLDEDKIRVLRESGVNRVSLGVQSFNARALKRLGRIHTAEEAVQGFRLLQRAGVENLNVDLIQSIPGMSPDEVIKDIYRAIELGPEHIASYNLSYEPGTPMTADRDAGRIVPPTDEEEADNYFAVKRILEEAGYIQYEISNFSRPGAECLHNLLYWQNGEYFGVGPSAHSHWNGVRYGNVRDLQEYCRRLENGEKPFDSIERLNPEAKAREVLVMRLRLRDGIDPDEFESATGFSLETLCGDEINHMLEEGLLQRVNNRIRISDKYLFISNAVLSELV